MLVLQQDGVKEYLGNYDYYLERVKNAPAEAAQTAEKQEKPQNDYFLKKQQASEERRRQTKLKKAEEEMKSAAGQEPLPEPAAAASAAAGEETEKSLVWQVNGRCDPHTVYVYVDGTDFQEGWKIHVDRFGSAKIYSPEEDWR